jgi:hypothetical protein
MEHARELWEKKIPYPSQCLRMNGRNKIKEEE